MDDWLERNPERIYAAQERWFGERQALRPIDHLSDLLARRLAFMPLVAGAKFKAQLPIENLQRERQVLDASVASARRRQLPEAGVRDFFALQIELAKAVQRRKREDTTLDLATDLRLALDALGERLIDALAAAGHAGQLRTATLADLEPTAPFLEPRERERLLATLHALAG
jgi:chorismate mutase-like protein